MINVITKHLYEERKTIMDKKAIIEQVINETGMKDKINAAFSEIEEQAKQKLIEELEAAVRKKLEKEFEKKAEEVRKKAKKRMRKMIVTAVACACSVSVLLSLLKLIPPVSRKD